MWIYLNHLFKNKWETLNVFQVENFIKFLNKNGACKFWIEFILTEASKINNTVSIN